MESVASTTTSGDTAQGDVNSPVATAGGSEAADRALAAGRAAREAAAQAAGLAKQLHSSDSTAQVWRCMHMDAA